MRCWTTSCCTGLRTQPPPRRVYIGKASRTPHLRDSATTYTLDPNTGYVVSHRGTNGFSCIVMRTEWSWPQLAFRDDIFVPICYDEEGSKKMLPVWMDVAEMRIRGLTPQQVIDEVMKKFESGAYQKPSRPGISYMTAP